LTDLLSDEHRAWIGYEDEPVHIEVSRNEIIKYSIATEQRQEKHLNGDEAPLMFVFNLLSIPQQIEDLHPDGLPKSRNKGIDLPLKRVMAGGTDITQHRPIRPGDRLTGITTIKDLYEKDGRQGPLIFTVRELHVVDAQGKPVFTETQTSIAR
jgi:3-methylfumaryl-CoA hydratase